MRFGYVAQNNLRTMGIVTTYAFSLLRTTCLSITFLESRNAMCPLLPRFIAFLMALTTKTWEVFQRELSCPASQV